jgi:NAD(P)-dependent dehydrogenase (short-subunit alcohol dehydrogenase family)
MERYGQSKLADILLAKGMAKRYPDIVSVSVHPGLVRTELGGRAERSAMLMVMESLRWTPLYKSPEKGAHNLLWAATTARGSLEGGKYYEPVGKTPGKPNSSSGMSEICGDEGLADQLWEWTEKELENLKAL